MITPTWKTFDGRIQLWQGDCLQILPRFEPGSIDAVVTDPPYDYPVIVECKGNSVSFFAPDRRPEGRVDEYLFWVKTPSTKNTQNSCGRFVEQIAVRRKGGTFNRLHWSQMIGVYDDRHVELTLFHPWEKPVSLIERLVRIYTDVEDVVCDPYMGSGTTAIACIRTGRQFWGIEIDPGYFDIARKRIQEELSGVCPTDALEPKGGLL